MATKKTAEAVAEAAEEAVKTITAKVIKAFKDKNTGKLYKVGETLTITEERYKEIMKVGEFLRKV